MGFFRKRALRLPVADLHGASIEVDGLELELARALVAARVEGPGLAVVVHHPSFPGLDEEQRARAAVEILVAALGEDGLRHVVAQVDPAAYPPIDPFDLTALRTFVRSLGVPCQPPEA